MEAAAELKPRHCHFPADQLHPAGPGCPRPQLSPGFQWGQPCLPAAASGTATAGEKRWIVLPRVPGTSPEMATEVCLPVLSPCSQFWGSHAPHPAPPPCRRAPVLVRVALGWGLLPGTLCSSSGSLELLISG